MLRVIQRPPSRIGARMHFYFVAAGIGVSRHDCHAKNFHCPPSSRQTARKLNTISVGPFSLTAFTLAFPVISATPLAAMVKFRSTYSNSAYFNLPLERLCRYEDLVSTPPLEWA